MLSTVLKTLEDHKAHAIQTLEVEKLTPFMDYLVICTANSTRHAKALAETLIKEAKTQGNPPVGVEGMQFGEWILVNLDSIVVHIMLLAQRELYQLEKLWTYHPISVN